MEIFTKTQDRGMKIIFCIALLFTFSFSQTFHVYTEQLPPFNYMENDKVLGSSTTLLKEMFKKSGHSIANNKINFTSWARGYHEALNTPNTVLYSAALTPARENLFKWVGPINKLTIGLIAKKSSKITIKDATCLNNYTIAVMPDTAGESILLNTGVKPENLERFSNATSQIKKLHNGRVDMMAFGVDSMFQLLRNEGIDPSEYEMVYVLKESDLYFAFHKDTDDAIIKTFNDILNTLKK